MGLKTFGLMGVDWEERVNLERLRQDRLSRIKAALKKSEMGSLLCFDMNNIRYITATHIGTWAMDKLVRFSLLPQDDEPIVWDFGSAARHHQIYCPWLAERSRAGISTLRGATHPGSGLAEGLAKKIKTELEMRKLDKEPLGVDVIELPVLFALQAQGIKVVDGQQLMHEVRKIKTQDEITLLNTACMMVDSAYDELYRFMKPGVRENECVGVVSKVLYDLGSEHVEGVNAISGERCSPHPHVYTDRVLRPGDPAFFDILAQLQRLPDLLLSDFRHRQRVTRYGGRLQALSRLHGRRDQHCQAGNYHRGHRQALAESRGIRFCQRRGGFRTAVRPRRGLVDLGEADLQPPSLPRSSRSYRGRYGLRLRNLLARFRRLVRRPARRGSRRDQGWLRSYHALSI